MNETSEVLNLEGEWISGDPTDEGQRYRKVLDFGNGNVAYVESIFTLTTLPEEFKVTRLAFKLRMTPEERKAIRNAAAVNDDVYDFMDLLSESTYVDLTRPETVNGINAMVGAGLIASDRAYAILNDPITDTERFNG